MELEGHSLERTVPALAEAGTTTGGDALALSVERYRFAARFVRAGRLLDLACGSGYGTRILVDEAPRTPVDACGVDIDEASVRYANEHFGGPGLRYECADALAFDDGTTFDTIVSIETIEHLQDPAGFCERMVSLLAPDGVLIASVPTTPSIDANPYHLHDFTERSFLKLFVPLGLAPVEIHRQRQPFGLFSVLSRAEPRMQKMRRNLPAWYLRNPGSLVRRLVSTLRYGFENRYATVAMRRPGADPSQP